MKLALIFISTLIVGFSGIFAYHYLTYHPDKGIPDLVQTIQKQVFSIDNPPSESLKGEITQMSGNVEWEPRTATQASELKIGTLIQQGEFVQTNETGSVSLQFGSVVNVKMDPETQVSFVQTLPQSFVMSIASGSAEFIKTTGSQVSVRSYHLLIRQNDGQMSVGVDTDNGLTNINLISGSITVAYNDKELNSKVVEFNTPQRITFNDGLRSFAAD